MRDHPFKKKLGKRKVQYVQEMLTMVKSYMTLEDKLTTHFETLFLSNLTLDARPGKNPTSIRMILIEEHWERMIGTSQTVSCEIFYQDCVNIKF